jgi:hypothetical protein
MIKFTIILLLLASLVVLVRALVALAATENVALARRLSWRTTFSLLVFFVLIFAFAMGWIHPHPLGATAIYPAHLPK